jgi:uncharacterized protein YutE (UPF0331/DUF86 family)
MAPEIVLSKLALLQRVLSDLKPHLKKSPDAQEKAHYEIERQVQLAVDICIDLGRRLLVVQAVPMPETARDVFPALFAKGVISRELADHLAASVGLRNLIVHEYGVIDYVRFFGGLNQGFNSFEEFAGLAAAFIAEKMK